MSNRIHPSDPGGSARARRRSAASAAAASSSSATTAAASSSSEPSPSSSSDRGRDRRGRRAPAVHYTVWKRSSMGFQGTDGFCVYDAAGALAFRVDNYSRRRKLSAGELLLMDGRGTPLLALRPQLLSLHDRWNCYIAAPEESLDVEKKPSSPTPQQQVFTMGKCSALTSSDDAEVYMSSSSARSSSSSSGRRLSCKHPEAAAAEPGYRVEGSFSRRSCKIRRGSDGREAARIVRKKAGVASRPAVATLGDDVFSLVVRPGVDAATIMAIVVVMDRICHRPYTPMQKELAEQFVGTICPKIRKKLAKIADLANVCYVLPSGHGIFQVNDRYFQYNVDILAKTCDRRKWNLTGIPCQHAISCLRHERIAPESVVHECYSLEAFNRAYESTILPCKDISTWEKVGGQKVLPPVYEKKVGRPPKCRKKQPHEVKGAMAARVHPNTAAVVAPDEPAAAVPLPPPPPTMLTVWRKSLLFNCAGFTVFDARGDLAFRVDCYGSSSRSRREVVLMDAAGAPLLTVRRRTRLRGLLLAALPTRSWAIYDGDAAADSAKPPLLSVRRGGGSKSKTLAHVTAPIASLAPGAEAAAAAAYVVEGSYGRRACAVRDASGEKKVVAEVQRKECVGEDVFRLVVAADPRLGAPLAMGLVIALDQIYGIPLQLVYATYSRLPTYWGHQ
ncbi:hypothetical protein U9M48_034771 [Paspalum notatum var. saurae]|uniref:Zinc finger PMZ-type domain-containing protein n=1 Tax=Paspalum notatum var. saurae TaxID=547442 RepID=A0AAQ3X702_PASNO